MQASRIFIAAVALWVAAMPAAVQAEQLKRLPQVGVFVPLPPAGYDPANNPFSQAMLEALKALGYVEEESIHIELRVATKPEEAGAMARDLVERKLMSLSSRGHS